jgi:pimeloyl-ACP methyl ester carboxylesterase
MPPTIVDTGQGSPLVLIPGMQGRWEWMAPSVDALATRCRVVTYSLGAADTGGFDNFIDQLDGVLTEAGLDAAHLCGVSFGGLIALRYAARRADRIRSLTLVSTPSPSWQPDPRTERYLRMPRLMAPVFVVGSPGRLWPEVRSAFDTPRERLAFAIEHTLRVARAPFSPVRMAARVSLMGRIDFRVDCADIAAPTLVVTGEGSLDQVVPVTATLEFAEAIAGADTAVLDRTGHIGFATRPERFAAIVAGFVERHAS